MKIREVNNEISGHCVGFFLYAVRFSAAAVCFCAALVLSNGPLFAGEPPFFERTLKTANAVVYFHPEDQEFARLVGEILDYASLSVGKRYGRVDGKVTAYIYRNNSEMGQGLRQILNYKPWEVRALNHVGVSECTKGTLHIHQKAKKWKDNPNTLWRIIIDEYVQGVTEQRFGSRPKEKATWIEEGVSSHIAYEAFKEKFPEAADQHLEWRQKGAFKYMIVGQFPQFKEISNRKDWYENITNSWSTWNSQYAAAYMGVLYIVNHYGFNSVEDILSDVSRGVPYTDALEDALGFSLDELESRVRLSVFLNGVFDLYFWYTALLLILVGLIILIIFLRWNAIRGRFTTRT